MGEMRLRKAIMEADASLDFAEVKAKGVVRDVLSWRRSREYFYYRVQRRQGEMRLCKAITAWLKDDAAKIADTVAAMKADGVAASVEQMLSSLPADARADLVKR